MTDREEYLDAVRTARIAAETFDAYLETYCDGEACDTLCNAIQLATHHIYNLTNYVVNLRED